MARPPRLARAGALYHVLNRGNYRCPIFSDVGAKAAFLRCLHEVCGRTGWQVHAWCIMDNHYHLALETPLANLSDGMQWLQSTFAMRFNRLRGDHGHLFQGRYKSLLVDPDEGLGPLCHYIHLNPVRAGVCATGGLATHRWSSLRWLLNPRLRPSWYSAAAFLASAGGLADSQPGRIRYLAFLCWLAEDQPEMKRLRFDAMSRGWALGSTAFVASTVHSVTSQRGNCGALAGDLASGQEWSWNQALDRLLRDFGRTRHDLATAGKSVAWKLAIGAALKKQSTATNRWLGTALHLGNRFEVSRKLSAWIRNHPRPSLTPNPKA